MVIWAARHVAVPYLIIHSKAQVMSFFEMGPTADCLTASLCIICDCSRSRHLPACHTPFEHHATAGAIHLTWQHASIVLGFVQHLLRPVHSRDHLLRQTRAGESAFCITMNCFSYSLGCIYGLCNCQGDNPCTLLLHSLQLLGRLWRYLVYAAPVHSERYQLALMLTGQRTRMPQAGHKPQMRGVASPGKGSWP